MKKFKQNILLQFIILIMATKQFAKKKKKNTKNKQFKLFKKFYLFIIIFQKFLALILVSD